MSGKRNYSLTVVSDENRHFFSNAIVIYVKYAFISDKWDIFKPKTQLQKR